MKKINKINFEEIMTLEEFINNYKNEIDAENVSDECINQMCAVILDQYNANINIYKSRIKNIYLDIIYLFYNKDDEYIDTWRVKDLFENIISLKMDYRFNNEIYNIDKISNEVYNEISYHQIFEGMVNREDFNIQNITNIEYFVNRLKDSFSIIKPENDLYEFVNSNLWRLI